MLAIKISCKLSLATYLYLNLKRFVTNNSWFYDKLNIVNNWEVCGAGEVYTTKGCKENISYGWWKN